MECVLSNASNASFKHWWVLSIVETYIIHQIWPHMDFRCHNSALKTRHFFSCFAFFLDVWCLLWCHFSGVAPRHSAWATSVSRPLWICWAVERPFHGRRRPGPRAPWSHGHSISSHNSHNSPTSWVLGGKSTTQVFFLHICLFQAQS